MSIELIVILELIAVLIIVLFVGFVIWRDKSSEITDLRDINQALITQLEQMQGVLDAKKVNQELVNEGFHELEDELSEQVNESLDEANTNIGRMEEIVNEHKDALNQLEMLLNEPDPDIQKLKTEIKKLKRLLGNTETEIEFNRKALGVAETNMNSMKKRARELSKQVISMNTLEASEDRLKREKTRLNDRMNDLKDKYDNQILIAKNLENELKTSFSASEVQSMKTDLENTEEELRRTVMEKAFIEQHFLELANNDDPEELNRELKRVQREIKQLEKSILDSE
ncbi:MAG: chromosome segregation ATPase [Bermanella sp.]|jgi:chromosome segregation ATPase